MDPSVQNVKERELLEEHTGVALLRRPSSINAPIARRDVR
jgi:hypothetical protein